MLARVRRSATALRDRMVGAPAAPEFVPKRNSALWRPLDRRLSGLAVLVSTVTPSAVDVVAKRARNCECNPSGGDASIS